MRIVKGKESGWVKRAREMESERCKEKISHRVILLVWL